VPAGKGEELNEITVLELGRESTWVMMLVAGPLLLVGTVVGVIVALLQALTTIQEMTLTFVPKIVAMLLAMLLFLPFMMTTLIEFTQGLFERIAQGG
jgi:flagellar biosynthesis protein FliQ